MADLIPLCTPRRPPTKEHLCTSVLIFAQKLWEAARSSDWTLASAVPILAFAALVTVFTVFRAFSYSLASRLASTAGIRALALSRNQSGFFLCRRPKADIVLPMTIDLNFNQASSTFFPGLYRICLLKKRDWNARCLSCFLMLGCWGRAVHYTVGKIFARDNTHIKATCCGPEQDPCGSACCGHALHVQLSPTNNDTVQAMPVTRSWMRPSYIGAEWASKGVSKGKVMIVGKFKKSLTVFIYFTHVVRSECAIHTDASPRSACLFQ